MKNRIKQIINKVKALFKTNKISLETREKFVSSLFIIEGFDPRFNYQKMVDDGATVIISKQHDDFVKWMSNEINKINKEKGIK